MKPFEIVAHRGIAVDYPEYTIQDTGLSIHAWDVNTQKALETIMDFNIPRICTAQFDLAADFRNRNFS